MADKYIRKDDAMDIVEYAKGNITWAERDDCKKRLKELPPADVVPVVRCEYCESYIDIRRWCSLNKIRMFEDDFCSYGERREE